MKKLFSIFKVATAMVFLVATATVLASYAFGEVSMYSVVGAGALVGVLSLIGAPIGVIQSTIPIDQARAALTNAIVAIYDERRSPNSFLRSLFPQEVSLTRYVSIAVRRNKELLAVDVERGTGPRWNKVTKSTLKTFDPPYFNEAMMLNALEVYDTAFNTLDPGVLRQLANEITNGYREITDKIDRTYEKQCADVLRTGVVTVNGGTNIDFKRKAASMVNDAGQYWAANTDPYLAMLRGLKFLREEGKLPQQNRVICILGEDAFNALMNNTVFQKKMDIKHFNIGDIIPATVSNLGASYHGSISVGSTMVDLVTYPETYEDENGNNISYLNSKEIIMTSWNPQFKFVFAGVPQLQGLASPMVLKQGFYNLEYIDPPKFAHVGQVMSAGVAVPYAIDQVYTQRVLA